MFQNVLMKGPFTNHAVFALLVVLLVALPTWSTTLAATSTKNEKPLVEQQAPQQQASLCFFLTETGGGAGGFAITNENGVMFASAFEQWGLLKIGYPISRRYERDGFVTQAFQKAIMQWRPDSNSVALANIFDDLHNAGHDNTLDSVHQVPQQLPPGWDGELDFQGVVNKRQGLLAVRPALSNSYFASGNPLTFYGLPTSEVEDMDSHYAVRLQRAVLQEWKMDVPWAKKGEVTIANGGQIAKDLGMLSAEITVPIPNDPCSGTTIQLADSQKDPLPQAPAPVPAGPAEQPAPAPAPAPEPAREDDPSKICLEDSALIEIESGLREPLTVNFMGFESGSITIPANGMKRLCLVRTSYNFSTEAESFRPLTGTKHFLSLECECWRLFFLFPWQKPCTCSNNADDYRRLP